MEDTAAGKETRDMTRSQIVKSTFRVLTLKLGKAGVPMIMTNHTYDVIGSMYPTKRNGWWFRFEVRRFINSLFK